MALNNYFLDMNADDVQEYALALCTNDDRKGFSNMLGDLQDHQEYLKLERMLMRTLLEHDHAGMFMYAFEAKNLVDWCQDNTGYVVAHSPAVLDQWLHRVNARQEDTMRRIAEALEPTMNRHLMAFLRGDLSETLGFRESMAHRALRSYLQDGAHHWREVSPAWIGPPGTPIRHMARDMGWSEKYLPGMVHRSLWRSSVGQWFKHTPYPYTLMACEEHRLYTQWGDLRKDAFASTPEKITCKRNASALDIAMAKTILSKVATAQLTLRRPPSVAPLTSKEETRAKGLVLAHIAMDSLNDFAIGLARGEEPLATQESLDLPPAFLELDAGTGP